MRKSESNLCRYYNPVTKVEPSIPQSKTSTIQQLIKLNDEANDSRPPQYRQTNIVEFIDVNTRNSLIRYPNKASSQPKTLNDQENLYDEINPDFERRHTYNDHEYDHLNTDKKSAMTIISQNTNKLQQLSSKINCFKSNQRKQETDYDEGVNIKTKSPFFASRTKSVRPERQSISYPSSNPSAHRLNRSFTASRLSTTSSGYDSDISSLMKPSSSIVSYFSVNDDDKQSKSKIRSKANDNLIDSAISIEQSWADESSLSPYYSHEPPTLSTSISSSSSNFSNKLKIIEDEPIQMQTSPFPKVKTCFVAQIKQIGKFPSNENSPVGKNLQEPIYENLNNLQQLHKTKQYSVKDVLNSLKNLEFNQIDASKMKSLSTSSSVSSFPHLNSSFSASPDSSLDNSLTCAEQFITKKKMEISPIKRHDSYDELCDEEVQYYLSNNSNDDSFKNSILPIQTQKNCYKIANRSIPLWEQLV